jgi:4-hydroxy-4-methyl-2-oxoglutarate aldolase
MTEQRIPQIGFRVHREISRPPQAIVDELARIPTPDLADAMYGSGAMVGEIGAAYRPMPRVAGPAVTVSAPTGSFPLLKMGMQQTRAGDVLVVNTRGATTYAIWGGNVSVGMVHRGVIAVVIDGCARDIGDAQAAGFPIFCRGTASNAPPLQGPGEVNVPIACGGTVVNPGDIVVADEDGVVVVPQAAAEEIIRRARDQQERYAKLGPVLRRGEVTNIEHIERDMREQGCQIV